VVGKDVASLALRAAIGGTMIAHGVKHGRTLEGTGRWFKSIGFRQHETQALASAAVEVGAGTLLLAGAATPLAASAVVATMAVAARSVHLPNGFFITGEGYEYVMNVAVASVALAAVGPGEFSVDHLLGLDKKVSPVAAAAIAAGVGLAAAAAQLAVFWRPPQPLADAAAQAAQPAGSLSLAPRPAARDSRAMKIQPRYGTDPITNSHPPIVSYAGDPAALAVPFVRQRLRLVRMLAGFSPAQWATPSRCAGWTNRHVVQHLVTADGFWAYSISRACRGEPSRGLADFDPVAGPAAMVEAAAEQSPGQLLAAYEQTAGKLADLIGSLTPGQWLLTGETALGHVSVGAVVRHAIWDGWVHERDIALGAGSTPPAEADELDAALRCVAALGAACGVLLGDLAGRRLAATVTTRDPAIGFTVEVDGAAVRVAEDSIPGVPVAIEGRAVDVLDALSLRGPQPLRLAPGCQWLTAGLARSFEAVPSGS
jgi:putative oxidoreductase